MKHQRLLAALVGAALTLPASAYAMPTSAQNAATEMAGYGTTNDKADTQTAVNAPVQAQAADVSTQAAPVDDQMADSKSYKLRPGDQLSIYVQQAPDMSNQFNSDTTQYQIRPDGMIAVPYVGEIYATGLTVGEFTQLLDDNLSRYFVNPNIAVNIIKLGGVRVYVLGEAQKPGVYELTKGHRVIDAIGAAGSFTLDAAKKHIYLVHQNNTNEMTTINLNKMLNTGDMSENYELQEGDIIFLTRNHRITFSRDISPLIMAAYYMNRIDDN